MKKIFSLFVAASVAMTLSAQHTEKLVATLQHGDQTSVFYGIDAFKQAYDAAADTLDVITLSSGGFRGPNYIEKSITVYGAGFETDTIMGIPKTSVIETYGIFANGVHLEGIYFDCGVGMVDDRPQSLTIGLEGSYDEGKNTPIYNLAIVKCHIDRLLFRADGYNCIVRQSCIDSFIGSERTRNYPFLGAQIFMHNFLVSNNYIRAQHNPYINDALNNGTRSFVDFEASSTIWVDHCVLMGDMMEGPWHYTNNTIKDFWVGGHCNIYLGDGMPNMFDDNKNWLNVAPEYVWTTEGEDGEYAEDKTFTIKLPELYIATDGTQIGLHGGTYAWNKIPSTPRIVECSIDTDNAANGTLKVSIKAEAQTKE